MSKKINCPHCDTLATLTDGGPYCRHCGWRRARVEENLHNTLKFDPRLAAFVLFACAMFALLDLGVGLTALVLSIVFYGLVAMWAIHQLRKLRVEPLPPALDIVPTPPRELDMFSAPGRTVRLSPKAKEPFAVAVFILVWLGLFALATTRSGKLLLLFTCVGILLATWWVTRTARRHKRLTAEGAVAVAKITKQWTVPGKGVNHMIEFQFHDALGQLIKGQAQDSSRSLYEDMTVPVFYNPSDPYDHLLAPLSYFEVIGSESTSQPQSS